MSIQSMAKRVGIVKKDRAACARLLRAVFDPPPPQPIAAELDIPTIHPYSSIWNLIELDPAKWQ